MTAPLFAVPDLDLEELDGLDDTEYDGGDGGGEDGEGLGDLPYLALRLLTSFLAKLDWDDELIDAARIITADEEDAQDIIRLIKASTIEVTIGDVFRGVVD